MVTYGIILRDVEMYNHAMYSRTLSTLLVSCIVLQYVTLLFYIRTRTAVTDNSVEKIMKNK